MTIDELERAAMQAARTNAPRPPTDLLDAHLYLALYSLYATHYSGQLTREQARPIKLSVIASYEKMKRREYMGKKLIVSSVRLWRDIGYRIECFKKERTLDNADAIVDAIFGIRRAE